MRRCAARRDSNEPALLANVEPLGRLLDTGPTLRWLVWNRRAWHLCGVNRPDKEGWASEFTDDQKRLIIRLRERQVPFQVLRTDADVLTLLGARQSA